MITPSIPPVPAPLPEGATAEQATKYWQQMDVYLRCVQEANNAEKHAAWLVQQEQVAAKHADWMAECVRIAARHLEDLAARHEHAKAQADTAVAMQASVDAQKAVADAMREPQWTRQGLTLWFLARLPEVTGLTDAARTDLAIKQADALLAKMPA